MRFFSTAFLAVSALFFVSSASAFSSSPASFFNHLNNAETHRHLSNLHTHLESNHNDLLSTMKSIHYHTQSMEDCQSLLTMNSRSVDKVKACLSISGSAAYDNACAADLNSVQCTMAIGGAIVAYGAGGATNSGGSTSGPSQQCLNAFSEYGKNVQTQCTAFSSKFTGAAAAISTATDINSLIGAQCNLFSSNEFSACKDALSGFNNVASACPEYGLDKIKGGFGEYLKLIDGPLTALCTKDDTDSSKYCLAAGLPSFQNFNIETVTDQQLNSICKPCMQTIMNKIAAFGGQITGAPSNAVSGLTSSMKYFNVLCTKDPTNPSKYCLNIFASLSSLGDKAKTATFPTNDDFRAICSPCMKAILVTGGDIFGAGQMNALKAFENYCTKEPSSGNYCGATVFGKFQNILGSLSVCDGTTCSDACKAAVSAIYSDQSCCFATVGFQTIISGVADVPALAAFLPKLSVASTCAIDVSTKKCTLPAPAALSIDLSLPNIAYDKITGTANAAASAAIKLALQKDLSFALGVDASAVIINDFSSNPSAKGGVKVSITINVDASFKSSYQSTLNAKLSQSGGLPLPSTAEKVEENKAALVAGEPVSAGGQASSGAINNNASIFVIAIATIIAVFFNPKF